MKKNKALKAKNSFLNNKELKEGNKTVGRGNLLDLVLTLLNEQHKPLYFKKICQEINCKEKDLLEVVKSTDLLQTINTDMLCSKEILKNVEDELAKEDILFMYREKEINLIQEEELMLIINDKAPNRKKTILSSYDVERGIFTLSKRMEKSFKLFPDIAYLEFKLKGRETRLWYFKKYKCLAGLKDFYKEYNLRPGDILELAWTPQNDKSILFEIIITGERETSIFNEGEKILRLIELGLEYREDKSKDTIYFLVHLLEMYPNGLNEVEIRHILKHFQLDNKDIFKRMSNFPFFEQSESKLWYCNIYTKKSYNQMREKADSTLRTLNKFKEEVVATTAEAKVLEKEKVELNDELAYIQNHYREEQALYQQKLSELAMDKEHLQLDKERLSAEIEQILKREESLKEEMDNQCDQLLQLRQERNKFKIRCENLESKVTVLQADLNETLKSAEHEIINLQRQIKEKKNQYESLQYANLELQKNMSRLHEERRCLKRKLNCLPIKLIVFFMDIFASKKIKMS